MNQESRVFVRKAFKRFYFRRHIKSPPSVPRREFGYGTLDDKIKIRHKAFAAERDFHNFLKREAPSFVSYSTAHYEFPANQPMEAKNWLGADLVFDLDRDVGFLDDRELATVKQEAVKVVEILEDDLGFSKNEIAVNFSGSKGYHIHVFADEFFELSGDARREIVDYVAGSLDFKHFLTEEDAGGFVKVSGPKPGDPGWAGRIAGQLHSFLSVADKKALKAVAGIGEKKAAAILDDREKILAALEQGDYSSMPDIISFTRQSIKVRGGAGDPNVSLSAIKDVHSRIIESIIADVAIPIRDADKMVTVDTARLIRVPDTIHGGSGLLAARVKHLDDFDPLINAVAFGGEPVSLELTCDIPEFRLGDAVIEKSTKGTRVEVPECAAIYLIVKGAAELAP